MTTTQTSSLSSESETASESTPESPVIPERKILFKAWWVMMLMTAMMKSHKGYMKTRTSRYRNGDKQRKEK